LFCLGTNYFIIWKILVRQYIAQPYKSWENRLPNNMMHQGSELSKYSTFESTHRTSYLLLRVLK